MHDDQIAVDDEAARRLIREQFPRWAALPIRAVSTAATMNTIFRIGDSWTARFPLRAGDPTEVRRRLIQEADAAREFAMVSTIPSPEPVALGEPGHGYPLPWAVQTWIPGHEALIDDPSDSAMFAEDLAALIQELRAIDTAGRCFSGDGRGGSLPDHDAWMALCFDKSNGLVNVTPLRSLWADLRTLPEVENDVMSHGDLTPPNVLVSRGRLVGVLDTGGFGAADPALDLVAVWHLLDSKGRKQVRQQLQCSEVQWRRGMAWALQQAIGLVWYYAESNPAMSRVGHRTLERLVRARDQ